MLGIGQTMAHSFVGRLVVLVHTDHNPDPSEWQTFVDEALARLGTFQGFLVVTGGGSLNANQRSDAIHLMKQSGASAAVLTTSPVVRGAVTAVSWFKVKVEAFHPSRLDEALTFANVDERDRQEAKDVVSRLTGTLPGVRISIPRAG